MLPTAADIARSKAVSEAAAAAGGSTSKKSKSGVSTAAAGDPVEGQLPEDGGYIDILRLIQGGEGQGIQDGSEPWDAADANGTDSGDGNLRVRSFDQITYNFYAHMTPYQNKSYSAARVYIEVLLPIEDKNKATIVTPAWMEDWDSVPVSEGGHHAELVTGSALCDWNGNGTTADDTAKICQILRGYVLVNSEHGVQVPGDFKRAVTIKVGSMTQGETIRPVIRAAIEGNENYLYDGSDCPGEDTLGDTSQAVVVTYDGNGHSEGDPPCSDKADYPDGGDSYNRGQVATVYYDEGMAKEDYLFVGWNPSQAEADEGKALYAPGSTFQVTASTTLYAAWVYAGSDYVDEGDPADTDTLALTYDGNGAVDDVHTPTVDETEVPVDPNSGSYVDGNLVTVLNKGHLAREGYVFAGWTKERVEAVLPGAAQTPVRIDYAPGAYFNITEDTTLYAVWILKENPVDSSLSGTTVPHGHETISYTPQAVTVTSKPYYNVELQFDSNNIEYGNFDFSTGNAGGTYPAANRFTTGMTVAGQAVNTTTVFGYAAPYTINLQLYNVTAANGASRGMKGMELPDGSPITLNLKLSSSFTPYSTNSPVSTAGTQYAPLLWKYMNNGTVNPVQDGRGGQTIPKRLITAPDNDRNNHELANMHSENNTCYEGGNWSATQALNSNVVSLTVKDYAIDPAFLQFPNSNYSAVGADYYSPPRSSGGTVDRIGCFSVGAVWVVQPFNKFSGTNPTNTTYNIVTDNGNSTGTFRLTVEDYGLVAKGVTGQESKPTNPSVAGDNGRDNQTVYPNLAADQNAVNDDINNSTTTLTPGGAFSHALFHDPAPSVSRYFDGLDSAALGQSDWPSVDCARNVQGVAANRDQVSTTLMKFDDKAVKITGPTDHDLYVWRFGGPATLYVCEQPNGLSGYYYPSMSDLPAPYNTLKVNILYATKKTNPTTGWANDAAMNSATEDDLLFYDTLDKVPAGHVVVAWMGITYGAVPDLSSYAITYAVPMDVKIDASLIGHVAQMTAVSRWWTASTMTLGATTYTPDNFPKWVTSSGMPNTSITMASFPTPVVSMHYPLDGAPAYVKESYDANYRALGTSNGYVLGDSLLIQGYSTRISKSVLQSVDGSADPTGSKVKTNYVVDTGERTADFRLQPSAQFPDGIDTSGLPDSVKITTLTIRDYLPSYMAYVTGSAVWGGAYSQPGTPGRRGTVTGGTALEPTVSQTTVLASDDSQTPYDDTQPFTVLTWTIPNVTVGDAVPPIYYSVSIGNATDISKDVPSMTNTNLTNVASIEGTLDRRVKETANGNVASATIVATKGEQGAFAKIAMTPELEFPGIGRYALMYSNSGNGPEHAIFMDTMPYNGDPRGSHYTVNDTGAHAGDGWYIDSAFIDLARLGTSIATAGLKVYYTEDATLQAAEQADSVNNAITTEKISESTITSTWTEATVNASTGEITGLAGKSPVAWAVIASALPAHRMVYVELGMKLNPKEPAARNPGQSVNYTNVYRNTISSGTSSYTVEEKSLTRTLEGIVWVDKDKNGIRKSTETRVPNLKVTLVYDGAQTTPDPADNSLTQTHADGEVVTNLFGKQCVTTTAADNPSTANTNEGGMYYFDFLPPGTFRVVIEDGATGARLGSYVLTKKDAGTSKSINSNADPTPAGAILNTSGSAVSPSAILSKATISGTPDDETVYFPTIDEMNERGYTVFKRASLDAGLVLVTDAEQEKAVGAVDRPLPGTIYTYHPAQPQDDGTPVTAVAGDYVTYDITLSNKSRVAVVMDKVTDEFAADELEFVTADAHGNPVNGDWEVDTSASTASKTVLKYRKTVPSIGDTVANDADGTDTDGMFSAWGGTGGYPTVTLHLTLRVKDGHAGEALVNTSKVGELKADSDGDGVPDSSENPPPDDEARVQPHALDAALDKTVSRYQTRATDGAIVWVTNTSSSPAIQPGMLVEYRIKVENQSRETMRVTKVTDYLPDGLVFVTSDTTTSPATIVNSGWSLGTRVAASGGNPAYTPVTYTYSPLASAPALAAAAGGFPTTGSSDDKAINGAGGGTDVLTLVARYEREPSRNLAEISEEYALLPDPDHPTGPAVWQPVTDVDSTPDTDPYNEDDPLRDGADDGDEDDIDDASLTLVPEIDIEKWITEARRDLNYDGDYSDSGEAIYTSQAPQADGVSVSVQTGDLVTYRIDLSNKTMLGVRYGYVYDAFDPGELEFDPSYGSVNADWEVLNTKGSPTAEDNAVLAAHPGKTVLHYLGALPNASSDITGDADDPDTDGMLSAWSGNPADPYPTVSVGVVLKVLPGNAGAALVNDAGAREITVDSDGDGTPDTDVPDPPEEESSLRPYAFDASLDKNVLRYQARGTDGAITWVTNTGTQAAVQPGMLVEYEVVIANESKEQMKVTEVTDYLPDGLVFVTTDSSTSPAITVNEGWTLGTRVAASGGNPAYTPVTYTWTVASAPALAPATGFLATNDDQNAINGSGGGRVVLKLVARYSGEPSRNYAEISEEYGLMPDPSDPTGPAVWTPVIDLDSTPDDDPYNEDSPLKDGVPDSDEDDIDDATLTLVPEAGVEKWITEVRRDLDLDGDYSDAGEDVYTSAAPQESGAVVPVQTGDLVHYRIDLSNKTMLDMRFGYVYDAFDPAELSFDPSFDSVNAGWEVLNDKASPTFDDVAAMAAHPGKTVLHYTGGALPTSSSILANDSDDPDTDGLLSAWDGTGAYPTVSVPVVLKVKPGNAGTALVNDAGARDISVDTDGDGEPDYPAPQPPEDRREIEPHAFDAALDKKVARYQVRSTDGAVTWVTNTVTTPAVQPGLLVEYEVTVRNESKEQMKVTEVTDYLPDGLTFVTSDTSVSPAAAVNAGWTAGARVAASGGNPAYTPVKYAWTVASAPALAPATGGFSSAQDDTNATNGTGGGTVTLKIIARYDREPSRNLAEISGEYGLLPDPSSPTGPAVWTPVSDIDSTPDDDPYNEDSPLKDGVPDGDEDDVDDAAITPASDVDVEKWIPEVDRDLDGDGEYDGADEDVYTTTTPQEGGASVPVMTGDLVRYRVDLVNRTALAVRFGYVYDAFDPGELEFDPGFDAVNGNWEVLNTKASPTATDTVVMAAHPGKTVLHYVGTLPTASSILSGDADDPDTDGLLSAWSGDPADPYPAVSVDVVLKVKPGNAGSALVNDAGSREIRIDSDGDGEPDTEIPDPPEDESELDSRAFDAALDKSISRYQVRGTDGAITWVTNTSTQPAVAPGLLVEYKVTVSNQSKETMKVTEVTDYLPDGLEFVTTDSSVSPAAVVNAGWTAGAHVAASGGNPAYTPVKYTWSLASAPALAPATGGFPATGDDDGKAIDGTGGGTVDLFIIAKYVKEPSRNYAEISAEYGLVPDPDDPSGSTEPAIWQPVTDIDSTPDGDPYNEDDPLKDGVDDGDEDDIDDAPLAPDLEGGVEKWIPEVDRDLNGDGDYTDADEDVYQATTPQEGGAEVPVLTGDLVTYRIDLANKTTLPMRYGYVYDAFDPSELEYDASFGAVNAEWEVVNDKASKTAADQDVLDAHPGKTVLHYVGTLPTASSILSGDADDPDTDGLLSAWSGSASDPYPTVSVEVVLKVKAGNAGSSLVNDAGARDISVDSDGDGEPDYPTPPPPEDEGRVDSHAFDASLTKKVARYQVRAADGTVTWVANTSTTAPAVQPGLLVEYEVTVSNQSKETMKVTEVTDYVPDGLTFVTSDPSTTPAAALNAGWTAGSRVAASGGNPAYTPVKYTWSLASAPALAPATGGFPTTGDDDRKAIDGTGGGSVTLTITLRYDREPSRNLAEVSEEYGLVPDPDDPSGSTEPAIWQPVTDIDSTPDDDPYNEDDPLKDGEDDDDEDDIDDATMIPVIETENEKWTPGVDRDLNGDGDYTDAGEKVYTATTPQAVGTVGVQAGDLVTFRIDLTNRTALPVQFTHVVDAFDPSELSFDASFAAANANWEVETDPDVLAKYPGKTVMKYRAPIPQSGLVPAWSGDPADPYPSTYVEIVLRVKDGNAGETLVNTVETIDVRVDADGDGEPDPGTPPGWEPPDPDDAEVTPHEYDASLVKEMAYAQVQNDATGAVEWKTADEVRALSGGSGYSLLPGSLIAYNLTVTNDGEVPVKATEIVDYVPKGLTFDGSFKLDLNGDGDTLDAGEASNDYWALSLSAAPSGYAQLISYFFDDTAKWPTGAPVLYPASAADATHPNSVTVPVILKLTATEGASVVNWAEIAREEGLDDGGTPDDPSDDLWSPINDKDSHPDKDPSNDDYDGPGSVDGHEDDTDEAAVTPVPVVLDTQVVKDTIGRTAAMYVTGKDDTDHREAYTNVGEEDERFRFDVDFRSLSSIRTDEFIVTDPLESADNHGARAAQTQLDELWTPVAYGDADGIYQVLYKTARGSGSGAAATGTKYNAGTGAWTAGSFDVSGYKVWGAFDDSSAAAFTSKGVTTRHRLTVSSLGLSSGDYVTEICINYGAVKKGFTTLNSQKASVNSYGLDGAKTGLPSSESGNVDLLTGGGEVTSLGVKASSSEGVESGKVDWTPKASDAWYSADAASAGTLKPATYLVKTTRSASGDENIVSSARVQAACAYPDPASLTGAVKQLKALDQDVALTKTYGTVTVSPKTPDIAKLVKTDSFADDFKEKTGMTYSGGKIYDRNGKAVKTDPDGNVLTTGTGGASPKTGDDFDLVFWLMLMCVAATVMLVLLRLGVLSGAAAGAAGNGAAPYGAAGYGRRRGSGFGRLAWAVLRGIVGTHLGKFLAITLVATLVIGAAAAVDSFAEPGDPENVKVDYTYGQNDQKPVPPSSIERNGRTYNLIATSDPVVVSSQPRSQSDTYEVDGNVTPEELKEIEDTDGIKNIKKEPVELDFEEEANKQTTVQTEWNDVDLMPQTWGETAAGAAASAKVKAYKLAEVSFEPLGNDADGVPQGYKAALEYRGIDTETKTGYYKVSAKVTVVTALDPVVTYRITAEYEPVAAAAEPAEVTPAAVEPEPEHEADTAATTGTGVEVIDQVEEDIPPVETPETAEIDDTDTPLGNFFPDEGEMFAKTTWSLASAVLSGIGIILVIILLVGLAAARREDLESRDMYYDNPGEQRAEAARRQRLKTCRLAAIVFGVLTPVIWLLLDSLKSSVMVWVNGWTFIVAAVFAVCLIFFLLHRGARKLPDDYADFDPYQVTPGEEALGK